MKKMTVRITIDVRAIFVEILAMIILLCLKLFQIINISWAIVLAPLWIVSGIIAILVIIGFIMWRIECH